MVHDEVDAIVTEETLRPSVETITRAFEETFARFYPASILKPKIKFSVGRNWGELQELKILRRARTEWEILVHNFLPAGELANAQKAITSAPLELGILLDRSYSMLSLQATTLQAFNALLTEQKQLKPDDARLTLMLFNHRCETVVDNHPLSAAPGMTSADYQPNGGTALWDGIGYIIETIGQRFDNTASTPRVLIVIITDGEETSSIHYSLAQIREMIDRRQRACGWSFIVIAPNAASLAFKLGIPVTHARNWK